MNSKFATLVAATVLLPLAALAQSLDTTFTNLANHIVYAIAPQTDGKVVVGGIFTAIGGQAHARIARIQADGTIESGFAPVLDSEVYTVVIERSGKILVGGAFSKINGANHYNLGRLNSDGSADGAFTAQANNYVFALNEQADGKILVAGYFTQVNGVTRNHLARLNADGTLDASFNPDVDNNIYALTVQSDGKILIGGSFTKVGGTARLRVARLNSDGSLDTSFNPGANNEVYSLVRQPDGKILIGGNFTVLGGQVVTRIGRLNSDGTVDNTFNAVADWEVDSIALQADGRIVLGGWFDNLNGVARAKMGRLNADGTLDTGFANIGFNNFAFANSGNYVYAVSLLNDGKIMVGGLFTTNAGGNSDYIARFTNPTAASQSVAVDAEGTTVTWTRGGSAPEVEQTTVEVSSDGGATYTTLGTPARVSGGWQLSGLALPTGTPIIVRARGVTAGGRWDASHSISEASLSLTVPTPAISYTLSGGSSLNYLEDSAPVFFDNGITLADSNMTDFNGGSLTVTNVSGGTVNDQLSIVPGGLITVSGATVSYNGNAIGTITTDGSNGQPLVISLNTADATLAAVQALVRQIAFSNNLDNPSQSVHTFKFRAVDALGGYGSTSFNVTVIPVNDAPSFTFTTANLTLLEDSGPYSGAIIASANGGGANETGQSITNYTVTAAVPSLFSSQPVIGTNGTLTFTLAVNANGSTLVTVVGQDNGGTANGGVDKTTNTFTIVITAVNDAPSATFATNNVVVAQDSSAYNSAFAVFSPGPANESGQSLVGYTLSNSSNALFSAQPALDNMGVLTFTPAAGVIGTATVTVITQDDGGTANGGMDKSTNAFTITIQPVNHAPSFALSTNSVTVLEDSGANISASFLTAISPGPVTEVSQVVSFVVTNDNNALFAWQPAISASGTLTFTPAANANGSATVTVIAHDNGGTAFGGVDTSAPQTFTINVTAVNDPPTLAAITNRTVANTAGLQAVNLTGISTGPANESAQNILSITATSSDASIVPNPGITYTPNNATGTLNFAPVPMSSGVVTITVVVQDDGGTANGGVDKTTNTFTVTVITAPVISPQPVSATVPLGGNTNFTVGATGSAPLAYQWFFNGNPVSGGTSPTLNITGAQPTDAGSYYVVVSNAAGSVTSSVVTLTVTIPAGSADPNFNPGANGPVMAVSYQTDGKILVGGQFTVLAGAARQGLGRLNTDGSIDAAYNAGLNSGGEIYAIAPAGGGAAYVAGTFNVIGGAARYNIARLSANGVADSFNPQANNYVYALLPQPDGKLLVGGYFTQIGGTNRNHLARLNSDGSVDTSFNPNLDNNVLAITLQPDGKILVGGVFTKVGTNNAPFVARLNADGSFDSSFTAFAHSTVEAIIPQPDGKILLAGGFDYIDGTLRQRLARVDTNGVLETTFDATPGAEVFSMQLQLDGKVLIGGGFPYAGNPANLYVTHLHLARVNADGTMDTNYTAGSDGNVYALGFASDGKLFVGGQFNHLGNFTRTNLGRFMAESAATESISNVFGVVPFVGTTTLTWQRGGAGAEVLYTTLETSSDGVNFGAAAQGTRVAGGWQWSNVGAPLGQTTYVRLRAYVQGGRNNGSVSVLQSSYSFLNPDQPPVVTLSANSLNYVAGSPAALLDTGVTLADGDSPVYNPGTVAVSYVSGGTGADVLSIPNVGNGAGQIGVSGGTVSFGGNAIGTFPTSGANSGQSGQPLVITLNTASATLAAVQALLRDLAFSTPNSATASAADRVLSLAVTDNYGVTTTTNLTVHVFLPPFITVNPVTQTVYVGANVTFTGAATGSPPITYQWQKNSVDIPNATNASLTLNGVLPVDNGSYTLIANNAYGTATTTAATLTVVINSAPDFTLAGNPTVLEDAGAQAVSGFLTGITPGTHPLEAMQVVTITVTNDNPALFLAQPAIDGAGQLTFTPAADANGSATVTVTAQDNGGTLGGGVDTRVRTFTITVTPVNDAPIVTLGAGTITVLEDSGATNFPGFATFSPGPANESAQTLVGHVLANNNTALFSSQPAIDNAGKLTFTPAPDANGSATVTVVSQDSGGTANGGVDKTTNTFTIVVTAVNDPPVVTLTTNNVVVPEDSGLYSALFATLAPGPANESAQTLTLSITNDNNALFSIQPSVAADGTLTFQPVADANGAATVTLTVQDNGGTANGGADTTVKTFVITVSPVNDPPIVTFSTPTVTVLEDSGAASVSGFATFSPGPPNESSQTLVGYTVSNDNAALFSAPPALDNSGKLTFTPAADANGSATVTVVVQDNGGTANGGVDKSTNTFTIMVTAVNDAPSVTFASGNVPVYASAGAFTQASFAAFSPGPANESAQSLVGYTVTAANAALFTVQPAIDNTGKLTFTPATNANAATLVTVIVQDNGGTANGGVDKSTNTFTITITSVNQAPSFTLSTGSVAVDQDSGAYSAASFAQNISPGPAYESSQAVNFIVSNDNNALFSSQPAISANGTLTFTPATGAVGSATVTVRLHDDGGTANGGVDTSTAQTFTITVTQTKPVLANVENAALIYDGGTDAVTSTLTASDPNSTTIASATVKIAAGYLSAEDVLAFANTMNITGSWDSMSGTLTLTGPDTVANFQAALRSITYQNTGGTPTAGTRTVTFQVDDGAASNNLSDIVSRDIVVVGSLANTQIVLDRYTNALPGQTISIAVTMLSKGTENSAGFSVNFNTNVLTYVDTTLGSDASGATLVTNANNAASGRVGVLVLKPSGNTFTAGRQQLAVLTFTVAANAGATSTDLTFGNSPAARQVTDATGAALTAGWVSGIVFTRGGSASGGTGGLEGDVNGDGVVTVADQVLIGRIVAGLDTPPTDPAIFQRADSAPRATLGDGHLDLADYVQAGRYAAGLDPETAAGGFTSAQALLAAQSITRGALLAASGRAVSVPSQNVSAGHAFSVPVRLNSAGNENSLGFSLTFDPAQLDYVSTAAGGGAAGAALIVNDRSAAAGRLGVIVAHAPGASFAAGSVEVALVTFRAKATASGATSITFSDSTVARSVVDAQASRLTASFTGGTVTVGAATLKAAALATPGQIRLSLDNGGQLSATDAGAIEVWWADSPAAPAAAWTRLTDGVTLVNGEVQVRDAGAPGAVLRFYKVIQRH